MKKINNYKLIEGDFDPVDASKILFTLVNSKINYHNLDAFSSHVRYGTSLVSQNKRIEELTEVNKAIKLLGDAAVESNKRMRIDCLIEIKLI